MREDPYVDDVEDADFAPEPTESVPVRRRLAPPAYAEPEASTWDESAVDDEDERPLRAPRRTARERPAIQRPQFARPAIPRAITGADVLNDLPALIFIAISAVGLGAMAILVANRISTLDEVIPTHVSASGLFERFASRDTIWQIPLLATMLTLMNLVAAWFISPLDRFASRFLLATSVVVQFVAWVAVLRILY
jgi:hypothetical protein